MTDLRFTGDLGAFQGIIFAVLVSAAAWFLYYRQVKNREGSSRFVLPSLRAGAIFLLIMMLTQPVLHHERQVGEIGKLYVVIDNSRSMAVQDASSSNARKILSALSQGKVDEGIVNEKSIANLTQIERAHLKLKHEFSASKSAEVIEEQGTSLTEALKSSMSDTKKMIQRVIKDDKAVEALFGSLTKLIEKYESAEGAAKLSTLQDLLRLSLEFEKVYRKSLYADMELMQQSNPDTAAAVQDFDNTPRWMRLQRTLFEGDNPLLDELAESHEIELLYLKGSKLESLWRSRAGNIDGNSDIPVSLTSTPNAEFTDLSTALVVAGSDKKSAIMLLSDGWHNHGEAPLQQAKILGNKGVKVYTVGYGSQSEPEDMAIQDISVPQSVYIKDRVRGSFVFTDNMKPGQDFKIKMIHEGKTLWEKELVSDGSGIRRLPYDFPVEELAQAKLDDQKDGLKYKSLPLAIKAEISFLEGDVQRRNNNSSFNVTVATRKRSILMIDQRPRWEWRYLNSMFERDLKWEMNAVLPVDNESRFERGSKKGMLPEKREELMNYELIILGDVNVRLFEKHELEWLREFVEQRAGGLILLDGRRNGLNSFAKTPLEALIPVKWKSATGKRKVGRLSLTEAGKNNAAFELGSEEMGNENVWKELPKMHWLADCEALPGSEVFVEEEVEEGKDKKATPVVMMRRFGAGKVFYSAAADFWRWRFKKGDIVHQRFWNQIVGWVMERPFSVQDKHVAIDAGKTNYDKGERADIRVRLRDEKGQIMVNAEAEAHIISNEKTVAKLPLVDNGGGLYTTRTGELAGGDYKVRIHVKGLDDFDMRAEGRFSVKEPKSAEMSQLTCNEKMLQDIAVNSDGVYMREEQIRDVLQHLKPLSTGKIVESDTALWQNYWYFIIVIFLFTTEWVWRKRKGMI